MVVYCGFIMIVLGVFGKFSALFVSIPEPIIGGFFAVLFGKFNNVWFALFYTCTCSSVFRKTTV